MAEAKADTKKPGLAAVLRSLGQAKTAYMLLFGFAAGLPYALVLGTLYAWLSDSGEIDLETMGVFSLIGLAYAFKFLWSPALDRVDIPGLRRLGKRKQWIVTAQVVIGAALLSLSFIAPTNETIGIFSLLAGLAALAFGFSALGLPGAADGPEALLELVDPSLGVDKLLLPSEERVGISGDPD